MLEALTKGYINAQDIIVWILIMVLVMIAFHKIWPVIQAKVLKDATTEGLPAQIRKINQRVDKVEEKLDRDYETINDIKKELRRQGRENVDSLEERQLLMSSMLAVLDGLSQLGTNGVTTNAQKDLQDYLNKKAHKHHETEHYQEEKTE